MTLLGKLKTCYLYLTKKEVQICCKSCECCGSPYVKFSNPKRSYDHKTDNYIYESEYECTLCGCKATNREIWKGKIHIPDKNSFRIPRHDNFSEEVKESMMNTFTGRRSL